MAGRSMQGRQGPAFGEPYRLQQGAWVLVLVWQPPRRAWIRGVVLRFLSLRGHRVVARVTTGSRLVGHLLGHLGSPLTAAGDPDVRGPGRQAPPLSLDSG